MRGSWNDPLGLSWLTITSAEVDLVIGASVTVDKFSIDGAGSLSFSTSPADLDFSINGEGQVLLAVSGIPISSAGSLFHSVVGSNLPSQLHEISTQGTVSFAVATYSSGAANRGFTLSAQATVTEGGTFSRAAKALGQDSSSQSYSFSFFSPIFDDPALVSLSLTETGAFRLAHSIECDSYSIKFAVASSGVSVSLATEVAVTFKEQSGPVVFDITGQWQGEDSVEFSGSLKGTWPQPFGLSWLSISAATIDLSVSAGCALSLSVSAAAQLTFEHSSTQATLSISTSETFVDVTVSATVASQFTLGDVAKTLVGRAFEVLDDVIQPSDVQVSLVLSTYSHGNVKEGFSIDTKGVIQGDLEQRLRGFSPKGSIGQLSFEVDLNVPLFSDNPADISLKLVFDDEIPISKHFDYEGITFELDTLPLAISADTEFKATFTKNPPLTFDIDGEFKADGSVLLSGEMIGTWDDVFGIKGFDLSNVIVELGVNPAMCGVDFCISDLGLGFIMQMGTRTIQFDGNAAAPDYEDMFLMGAVTGPNGMALTVWDVVLEWNRMFPDWKIPERDVPQNWGLDDTSFYLAPVDGTFGNIHYHEGFSFDGGIRLLDMDLHFLIDCGDQYALGCDFNISVDLDWDLFHHMIDRELLAMNQQNSTSDEPEFTVFKITDLSLSEWSAYDYSHGKLPRWQIGLTILDKPHHLDFRVEQYELASTFHQFFEKWLSSLF